jgi:putative transferase (TIGR04331 family)
LSSKYLCESHSRIFKEVQVGETIDISAFLIKYFFWFIPKSYYENFFQINDIIFKFFPKNIPNVIFTSNSFDTDDIFKVYLISRINLGSKYFVGQHGAQFGVNKYYLNTNEIVTTDSFFTWGWGGYGKFYKGVFLKKSIVSSFKFRSKILLVQKCIDHSILPYDNFYEYERYISKQFNFVNKLKRDFKSQIVVRIMAGSKNLKGYDFERWQQINLPIDQGVVKISEVISNYKLVIFTYDSTVMYEIIDSGIPFIFVSFENYFISDEAKPFFAKLKKSNIYFDNYEAAINFLNNNLNFIDQWWSSDLVQISLAEYKNKFCNNIYSPNASLFNFISNNNL